MGFDDWFKKKFKDLHEAVCCGDLVASNYKKAIKKGFNAGAASRQDEIDELKKMIKYMKRTAQRIMIAIDDGEVDHARRSARKILKGDQS